jgi:D-alanyl-D-alanine carboxypeptidase
MEENSMSLDHRPTHRSGRARLNRRQVLKLAAGAAAGGLATSSLYASALAAHEPGPTRGAASETSLQQASWEAELTNVIPQQLAQAGIPGAIVGVWQDGQVPYVRAFGVRDVKTLQPMTTDLYMRIGSNTKAFTTTAVLQLVDQGRIGLDDPVATYVPGVPNGNEITIRQLGMMRSGLFDYSEITVSQWPSEPNRQWTAPELLAIAFSHPTRFAPGAEFDYDNTNTVLLGAVVEQITGQWIGAYIDTHILTPLQLAHTVYPVGPEFPAPHSQGYWLTPSGEIVENTDWNYSWGNAAGIMISTVDDLHVWARALATGALLSPATQRQRELFLPAPDEGEGVVYGFGMTDNNGWRGHDGNVLSNMAYPFYLPAQRMTMVVLLNSSVNVLGANALMQAITRAIAPNNVWPNPPPAP